MGIFLALELFGIAMPHDFLPFDSLMQMTEKVFRPRGSGSLSQEVAGYQNICCTFRIACMVSLLFRKLSWVLLSISPWSGAVGLITVWVCCYF